MFTGKKAVKCAVTILIIQSAFLQPSFSEVRETTDILFIGSSYFNYNDLPDLFINLAENSGKQITVTRQIQNGLYLSDHASSSTTELKINEKDWDFVILQGVGSVTAYPNYYTAHPVFPALETLQSKILNNCESTKIIFCLPWAFEDGMTWVSGWTDTYEDMQIKIYDNTLLWCDSLDIMVAPVGWAWYEVLEKKDYPLHYLHLSDWNHPSLKGSYLMACTIFSTVYQEGAQDISYFGGLIQSDAEYFQSVASDIVLRDLELWNITDTDTGMDNSLKPVRFILEQNYPNPFNQSTRIEYEVLETAFVEIEVFDIHGQLHVSLVNEYKPRGHYSVQFSQNFLYSGIYFYRIKSDRQQTTRKMMLIK